MIFNISFRLRIGLVNTKQPLEFVVYFAVKKLVLNASINANLYIFQTRWNIKVSNISKKKIIFNCLKLKLEKYSRIPYLKYRHFFLTSM